MLYTPAGAPFGYVDVAMLAHVPPVVFAQPTELLVVAVGALLFEVNTVAWYSMSFCVADVCEGHPRSIFNMRQSVCLRLLYFWARTSFQLESPLPPVDPSAYVAKKKNAPVAVGTLTRAVISRTL